jgi:polyisoprenoid-binding protein YceI
MKLRVNLPVLFAGALFSATAWTVSGDRNASPVRGVEIAVAAHPQEPLRLATSPDGNEARYRVNEQLARIDFPSDAVGRTAAVNGTLVVQPDGTIAREGSRFTVDLATLKSDSDRRDNYIQRRTLETATHPTATFVPTAFLGLQSPLPAAGEMSFQLVGDLTVHGVTRPVTWDVTARAEGGAYTGTASTWFRFGNFEMTIPRVASVLSVKDSIVLEYDFRLVPATPRP